jgi:aspartate oxidase
LPLLSTTLVSVEASSEEMQQELTAHDVLNGDVRHTIQKMMTTKVGIVRRHVDMEDAHSQLKVIIDSARQPGEGSSPSVFDQHEVVNLITAARALIEAALCLEKNHEGVTLVKNMKSLLITIVATLCPMDRRSQARSCPLP